MKKFIAFLATLGILFLLLSSSCAHAQAWDESQSKSWKGVSVHHFVMDSTNHERLFTHSHSVDGVYVDLNGNYVTIKTPGQTSIALLNPETATVAEGEVELGGVMTGYRAITFMAEKPVGSELYLMIGFGKYTSGEERIIQQWTTHGHVIVVERTDE